MHRVELKEVFYCLVREYDNLFLMHRVELKVRLGQLPGTQAPGVPNAPCGVERRQKQNL